MRVATLPARYVQNSRSNRQFKDLDEPRCFFSIAFGREEETVLAEIVGVECRLPPLARLLQKKTGSR